jgi:chaperonin GroES
MSKVILPVGDRIMVKAKVSDGRTEGGLYIPDTVQQEELEGTVIKVGEGKITPTPYGPSKSVMPFLEGDRVMYGKYAGVKVTIDGEEYIFLKEEDVICIIR